MHILENSFHRRRFIDISASFTLIRTQNDCLIPSSYNYSQYSRTCPPTQSRSPLKREDPERLSGSCSGLRKWPFSRLRCG